MTIFTVPRGQARALWASLLPHAGKQSEKTPLYGRIRFAPGGTELVAWTVDGSTAAAAFIDVDANEDGEADVFDLSVPAIKAALAVFRGPSDADARQMWEDQPLRFTVTAESVTLEEVDGILEGRQLVVERWVTAGEDHYPDVPRLLTAPWAPTERDTTVVLVSPSALAKFTPSARAWDNPLRLLVTGEPHRVEVRVGARFTGLCPAIRRDEEDESRAGRAAAAWLDRLVTRVRPSDPAVAKAAAAWHLATGLRALGMTGLDDIDDEYDGDVVDLDAVVAGVAADPAVLARAAELVITTQFGSPSMLQRRLGLTLVQVGDVMTALEGLAVISPANGIRAREVLIPPGGLDGALAAIAALSAPAPAADALTDDPDDEDEGGDDDDTAA